MMGLTRNYFYSQGKLKIGAKKKLKVLARIMYDTNFLIILCPLNLIMVLFKNFKVKLIPQGHLNYNNLEKHDIIEFNLL